MLCWRIGGGGHLRGGLSLFHDQTTNFGADKVPIDVTILILDVFLLQCVYDYHIGTNFIIIPSIPNNTVERESSALLYSLYIDLSNHDIFVVTYFWLSLLYCPKNCSKTKGIFAKVLQWGRVDVDSVCWNCNTIGSPLLCGTSGGNFPPEIRWNVSLPNLNRCSSWKKE